MPLVEVSNYTPKAWDQFSPGRVQPTNAFALKFSSTDKLTDLTTIYTIQHAALGCMPLLGSARPLRLYKPRIAGGTRNAAGLPYPVAFT